MRPCLFLRSVVGAGRSSVSLARPLPLPIAKRCFVFGALRDVQRLVTRHDEARRLPLAWLAFQPALSLGFHFDAGELSASVCVSVCVSVSLFLSVCLTCVEKHTDPDVTKGKLCRAQDFLFCSVAKCSSARLHTGSGGRRTSRTSDLVLVRACDVLSCASGSALPHSVHSHFGTLVPV